LEYSEKILFVKMKLGTNFNISFDTVPIEALVHPLCVIQDCSGDRDIYFVVLPKHSWNVFFEEKISLLPIFRHCTCVRESINIRGHQQYTAQVIEGLDNC
jgi:hypothetical protein